jgi:hypothetical protein
MPPAPTTSLDLTRDITDDTIPENEAIKSKHAPTNTTRTSMLSRTPSERFFQDEVKARKHAKHNALYLLVLNTIAAVIVFAMHLFSLESLLSIGLSVGFTMLIYRLCLTLQTCEQPPLNYTLPILFGIGVGNPTVLEEIYQRWTGYIIRTRF